MTELQRNFYGNRGGGRYQQRIQFRPEFREGFDDDLSKMEDCAGGALSNSTQRERWRSGSKRMQREREREVTWPPDASAWGWSCSPECATPPERAVLARGKERLSTWGRQKIVAAADLVATRCERVGQVVLVAVRRPAPPEREI
jgi:hypothetical protein